MPLMLFLQPSWKFFFEPISLRSSPICMELKVWLVFQSTLKIQFQKREAKIINCRDYKNFSNEEFRQQVLKDVLKTAQNGNIVSYESFLTICQWALDSRASKKQKYVRSNQSPFINKNILKTTMDRSRLRNKFLKTRSNEEKRA